MKRMIVSVANYDDMLFLGRAKVRDVIEIEKDDPKFPFHRTWYKLKPGLEPDDVPIEFQYMMYGDSDWGWFSPEDDYGVYSTSEDELLKYGEFFYTVHRINIENHPQIFVTLGELRPADSDITALFLEDEHDVIVYATQTKFKGHDIYLVTTKEDDYLYYDAYLDMR